MCVLDAAAVENCCFGAAGQGLASVPGEGKIVVDHSTINPDATRDVAARLRQKNAMRWVDAPVSGGPGAARDGSMTVMAGGDAADIAAIRPLMQDMAGHFTHVGALGAGQTAKILNQAIVGTGYVLMAEALALAEAAGLDAAKLPECLAGGHADSNLLRKIYPQMCARAFEPPTSYARQLAKDLKNVAHFVHEHGCTLPLIEAAVKQYTGYVAAGNEMKDSTSVALLYDKQRR
jgi:3-hydroxyisobutyrate dehydrogenase